MIGGPTASGKSGLALRLARLWRRRTGLGAVVINADSMQVYAGLPVLTAQPDPTDSGDVPHRLYGVIDPAERMSAARWRDLALAEIAACGDALPILVGGTGLYLRTLMHGIADIPAIPDAVRAAAKALHADLGGPGFHARLAALDPAGAARLAPGDTQRLIRAWEVVTATGRTLDDWHARAGRDAPIGLRFIPIVVDPPRDRLYAACDRRFDQMMARGALAEVRALMERLSRGGAGGALDPDLPATKALGVPELAAFLRGECDLDAAVDLARRHTRNYAKRQTTWFRHQMPDARRISDPETGV